jgi:hypothetical protein
MRTNSALTSTGYVARPDLKAQVEFNNFMIR